jgi:hypothetical protein
MRRRTYVSKVLINVLLDALLTIGYGHFVVKAIVYFTLVLRHQHHAEDEEFSLV